MRFGIFLSVLILFFFHFSKPSHAIENPFSSFNNKAGIHILFPEELQEAAALINTNGGDWGYVTIPIQTGDKNPQKWQAFMDSAKKLRVIPIIRLATEIDSANIKNWRRPNERDILDFANFLNSLNWPIKNRYVIVFNEVNRADEWGGSVDAASYSKLLAYTVTIFKSKSPDFFIINAGLDNAAPNKLPEYQNQYNYLLAMNEAVPGIFNQIDGFSSHSYPNPGFSQHPTVKTNMSIFSFDFERKLIRSLSNKNLPIFITETGWSADAVSELARADYLQYAFKYVWSDINIVAITPFLLRAQGPFEKFSFIDRDGLPVLQHQMLKSLPKVRGMPKLVKNPPVLLRQQRQLLGLRSATRNIDKAEASANGDYYAPTRSNNILDLSELLALGFRWLIRE